MTKKYNPDDYIYESFKTKIYPTKEQKNTFINALEYQS